MQLPLQEHVFDSLRQLKYLHEVKALPMLCHSISTRTGQEAQLSRPARPCLLARFPGAFWPFTALPIAQPPTLCTL